MILLTGAKGLIGSAIEKKLIAHQVEYTAVVRQHISNPRQIKADLAEDCRELLGLEPKVIIHCAAVVPNASVLETHCKEVNRKIDRNVISLASNSKALLVYLSGTSVYGFGEFNDVKEDVILKENLSPYVHGKLLTEQEISKAGLRSVILRVSAPYGDNLKHPTVLKTFIESAINNKDLLFYGTGQRKQDFTHVSDIGDVAINVLNRNVTGTFNISYGSPVSMLELAHLVVSRITGCTSRIVASGKPDPQEGYRASFDTSSARKLLDWNPKISIQEGIDQIIKSAPATV